MCLLSIDFFEMFFSWTLFLTHDLDDTSPVADADGNTNPCCVRLVWKLVLFETSKMCSVDLTSCLVPLDTSSIVFVIQRIVVVVFFYASWGSESWLLKSITSSVVMLLVSSTLVMVSLDTEQTFSGETLALVLFLFMLILWVYKLKDNEYVGRITGYLTTFFVLYYQ